MVESIIEDFEIFVNDILDNTGKIALKYFRDLKDLSLKRDMSPVTKADKEIEKYIRTQILNHYPKHNIVGEEYKEVIGTENITWYIDPIDGTRSFLAGKHDFGTLISLVIDNHLVAGVIDCPALNERWSSFQPNLTKVNNQPTICKSVEKLEDAVMATTSSHEFGMKKWRAYQSLEQSVKVTTTGSDCYNYGLLASGHIDIVAERLSFPHDYLPLIKIVEGAGGIMTDWEGKKLSFDETNVYVLASASKQIHEQALSKLKY